MQKRGQVSTYVIIGVAIAILVVVGYTFRGTVTEKRLSPDELAFQSEAEPVRLMVENCFEDSSLQALYMIGLQGA